MIVTERLQKCFSCHKGDLAMKKSLIVLFSAALLGLGAATFSAQPAVAATYNVTRTNPTDNDISHSDFGVVTVGPRAAMLYTDHQLTKAANRTLPAGSEWRYTVRGIQNYSDGSTKVWSYRVGTNLWLPASESSVLSYQPGFSIYHHDIVQVLKGGAPVYSDIALQHTTGRKLPAGSRWQFGRALINDGGQLYVYQVGGNEFVAASNTTLVQRRGIFTVGHASAFTINSGRVVGRQLAGGSRWQTNRIVYMHGGFYYQVATDLYIGAIAGTWTPSK
jgi:hypothetical protein